MCNELVLGEIRVRLDLKDGRLDACNRHNVVNLLAVEVGQANVLCESGIDELLHRTVCVDVRRVPWSCLSKADFQQQRYNQTK